MAFKPYRGGNKMFKIEWWTKKASTAFTQNALVYEVEDGTYIVPADATSGNLIGIILRAVTSSSSDYASNTKVPVLVPISPNAEIIALIGSGTAAATMEGSYYDLVDSVSIDLGNQSKKVILFHKYISATKAVIKINAQAAHANVATT